MADDLQAIRKLASLDDSNPSERVYVIRQILDNVRRAGYEDGYTVAMRDKTVADILDEATFRDAAQTERARITAHFDDMVITRQHLREFETRHHEHVSDKPTVFGVLKAVVEELEGMSGE